MSGFPFYFYFSWQVVWLAAFRWTLELPIVEKWIFKSSHVSANAQLRDSFHTRASWAKSNRASRLNRLSRLKQSCQSSF
jgi:hypothetical protein